MLNATFMGVTFSPDGTRFYVSGGENGNIWIGDVATGQIVGSVNLNGPPIRSPARCLATADPPRFKGAFPGNMALTQRRALPLRRRPGQLPGVTSSTRPRSRPA